MLERENTAPCARRTADLEYLPQLARVDPECARHYSHCLFSLAKKHEPSLLHVNVVTQQAFDTKDSSGSGEGITGAPERPDWVKAVEKVSEENGIPLTHVKDM